MVKKIIAHVKQNPDGSWEEPHLLEKHLMKTAERARAYASKFDSGDWGEILGLAHDLGKGRDVWQAYLRTKSGYDQEAHLEQFAGRVTHAIHGAKVLEQLYSPAVSAFLSYCVAGHHAGLPDWSGAMGEGAPLEVQLEQAEDYTEIYQEVISPLKHKLNLAPPWQFTSGLDLALWIRMLFSCLVDADFLDTEKYKEPIKSAARSGFCNVTELADRFEAYYSDLVAEAKPSPVNQLRTQIKEKCVVAGKSTQGIFSLTVPTGGGKTLASLAFALEHAKQHCLDRIIHVIPYTSIIEQNAKVLKEVFGDDQVVEHHSNFDEEGQSWRSRLAAENWDAPIIATTSVQFFESLFAAKPNRCRKLHNIAKSVVILDEAQLLPVDYLEPILEVMELLVKRYKVTFVICTATQPALGERQMGDKLFRGLKNIREIIGTTQEVVNLQKKLRRVRVSFPSDLNTPLRWEDLAEQLKQYGQVLCIVSDRKSCKKLHSFLPQGTFHLSALMCGEHRAEVIERIKSEVKLGKEVRVVSTQLVEAGVDLDFPVVYRALAGLDSIVQAAGRCNRESELDSLGQVVVFVPPKRPPAGLLRKAEETTRKILIGSQEEFDPFDPDNFHKFFSELYWKAPSLDVKGIKDLLTPRPPNAALYFRTAAKNFRLIENDQKTVLVPFGEGEKLITKLRKSGPDRQLMRKLQRYSVSIYPMDFSYLAEIREIEEVHPGIWALTTKERYCSETGLKTD